MSEAEPPKKTRKPVVLPPEQYRFKKGQSGNPGGKLPDPPELRALQKLTKQELVELGNVIVKSKAGDIHELSRDPNITTLQKMIISVCLKVMTFGDMQSLNLLLDRLVGKVKDEIEFKELPKTETEEEKIARRARIKEMMIQLKTLDEP